MSATTPAALRRRPKDDRVLGLTFIVPAAVGLIAFYIWPLIRGIWLSFTEYNLLTPEKFAGLDNYKRMVHDDTFWNAVWVTLEYVVINIGLQTILALAIAVLMQRLTQSTFVRSIVLTPYLVSNVVAAMLWLDCRACLGLWLIVLVRRLCYCLPNRVRPRWASGTRAPSEDASDCISARSTRQYR